MKIKKVLIKMDEGKMRQFTRTMLEAIEGIPDDALLTAVLNDDGQINFSTDERVHAARSLNYGLEMKPTEEGIEITAVDYEGNERLEEV